MRTVWDAAGGPDWKETAMNAELREELAAAITSHASLEQIVALLRRYKAQGISQGDVYSVLEALHQTAPDEAVDDRILEVADFVAGFCAPHMKIWDSGEEQSATESMPRL